MKKILLYTLLTLLVFGASCTNPEEQAAKGLAKRILPNQYRNIEFKLQTADTNFYSMYTENGRLHITADCSGSMAKALGDYLRDYCHTEISWFDYNKIVEPEELPVLDSVVCRQSLLPNRFFFNYCTYAYTVGYWNWEQWERFIDWMAMNGVTMALAHTGHEAVWQKVYQRFGLSDEEILSYFTGPSTLAFNRMANIEKWNGPLPQKWIDGQRDLQKKIIEREKSLGISPILNSFTGHVPEAFAKHYPDAKISEMHWLSFQEPYTTWYLNPSDSLYAEVLSAYHEEQEKMYGIPSHYYCVDLFNEMAPPSWEPEDLAAISKSSYDLLAKADPDAVWIQMSWMFLNEKWTPERLEAYLTAVPKHKVMLLDYAGDFLELYEKTNQFSGQDFLWCYLGNFGGHTVLGGNIVDCGKRLDSVFVKAPDNCVGIGCTLEGFGCNPEMYEFALDRAWEKKYPTEKWLEKMADRRLGKVDENNRKAWRTLRLDLLDRREDDYWVHISYVPSLGMRNHTNALKDNKLMLKAWGELLNAENTGVPAYNFDCVNFGRNCLDTYFSQLIPQVIAAYDAKDKVKVKEISNKMLEILDDIEKITGAERYFLLGYWMEQARQWGDTPEEKEYYGWDAKSIVSTWAHKACPLIDYACREYNGLVGTYYKPRWEEFLKQISECEPFDGGAFNTWRHDLEWDWLNAKQSFPVDPVGDGVEISRELYNKYKDEINQ